MRSRGSTAGRKAMAQYYALPPIRGGIAHESVKTSFYEKRAERRLRYSFPRLVQPQPLAKAEPLSPFQEKRKTLFNYMLPTHVGNRAFS